MGRTSLDADRLLDYVGTLQSWARSLTEDADLLLYGCDLAADGVGQSFVSQIAALTGANVTNAANANGSANLTVRATDPGGLFVETSFTVTVAAVNDAPLVNLASSTQSILSSNSPIGCITISDIDAGTNPVSVTLKVNSGTLNVAPQSGVTIGTNNSGTVILTGTIANLNTALTNLRYSSTNNFSGNDSLNVTVNDQGNSGTGGALTVSKAIALNVARNLDTLRKEIEVKGALTSRDTTELYQFTVSGQSRKVEIELEGLKDNADLVILDRNFNVIATSSQLGNRKESLKRLLAAGTDYIQVKLAPGVTTSTSYELELEVDD